MTNKEGLGFSDCSLGQVDIFDDRIEVSNVGALIPPLTRKNLGKIAVRRNPLLADLFHRAGYGEKMGTGIRRMMEESRERKISFELETNGYFISRFLLPQQFRERVRRVGESSEKTRVKTRVKILRLIQEDPQISAPILAERLGLSNKGIEWNLQALKKKGLLKREGSPKGGRWVVLTPKSKRGSRK